VIPVARPAIRQPCVAVGPPAADAAGAHLSRAVGGL